jgi:hypothetical protein
VALSAGRGRGEHCALDGGEALIDPPERDLDGGQAFIEADEVGAELANVGDQIVDAGVHVVDARAQGVDAGVHTGDLPADLRRQQAGDGKDEPAHGSDDPFRIAAHVPSYRRGPLGVNADSGC